MLPNHRQSKITVELHNLFLPILVFTNTRVYMLAVYIFKRKHFLATYSGKCNGM